MPSLLEPVLEARGAARFGSVSTITARVEYGGTFGADRSPDTTRTPVTVALSDIRFS